MSFKFDHAYFNDPTVHKMCKAGKSLAEIIGVIANEKEEMDNRIVELELLTPKTFITPSPDAEHEKWKSEEGYSLDPITASAPKVESKLTQIMESRKDLEREKLVKVAFAAQKLVTEINQMPISLAIGILSQDVLDLKAALSDINL